MAPRLLHVVFRLVAALTLLATTAIAGATPVHATAATAASSASSATIVPTHLSIPRIGVDAPVEQVGLTADKAVDVPKSWNDAGWYNLGYQPGTPGNSVIVGHLDSTTGPAVFWNVGNLRAGDAVDVDDGSTTLRFIVQEVDRYPADNSPMLQVYGPSGVPRLNLVTCTGDWDPVTHRYSDRLVVYTVEQGYTPAPAAPTSQYFSQTGGYVVSDDPQAHFLSEFNRLGGVPALGYPVSRRFVLDGFVVQAFQKAILQWRPDSGQATFLNVLDRLHDAGDDGWLRDQRMTPPPDDTAADAGLAWSDVVARHQAVLQENGALQQAYFAADDPVGRYGLPVSGVVDEGPALVVRCQRAVLQLWKSDEPWAAAGQVTIANGGDLAKQAGLIPQEAMATQ